MLITTIPYLWVHTPPHITPPHTTPSHSVVQGADWHWGPSTTPNMTNSSSGQPDYIRNSSLATCIMATIFLIAFLVFQVYITALYYCTPVCYVLLWLQVLFSVGSRRKDQLRREETWVVTKIIPLISIIITLFQDKTSCAEEVLCQQHPSIHHKEEHYIGFQCRPEGWRGYWWSGWRNSANTAR